MKILDYIPRGQENAVSMADLAAAIGTDERTVRKIIEKARLEGAVIIGDNSGYYKPASRQELEPYVHRIEKKARKILAAVGAGRRLLREMPGQQEIDLREV